MFKLSLDALDHLGILPENISKLLFVLDDCIVGYIGLELLLVNAKSVCIRTMI